MSIFSVELMGLAIKQYYYLFLFYFWEEKNYGVSVVPTAGRKMLGPASQKREMLSVVGTYSVFIREKSCFSHRCAVL